MLLLLMMRLLLLLLLNRRMMRRHERWELRGFRRHVVRIIIIIAIVLVIFFCSIRITFPLFGLCTRLLQNRFPWCLSRCLIEMCLVFGLFESISTNAPLRTPCLSPIRHSPILSSKQQCRSCFGQSGPIHQFDTQTLFKFRDIIQLQDSLFGLKHSGWCLDGSFFQKCRESFANGILGLLPCGISKQFLGSVGIVGVPFVRLNGVSCQTSVMIVEEFEKRIGTDPMR